MRHLPERSLRWNIQLKLWLIGCLVLSIPFSVVSALSTLENIEGKGMSVEANPVTKMLLLRFGIPEGIIIHQIGSFVLIILVLFFLYKHRNAFFALFAGHLVLMNFLLLALNDFFRVALSDPGKMRFFFKIFDIYPFNIVIFVGLALLLTFLTTERK